MSRTGLTTVLVLALTAGCAESGPDLLQPDLLQPEIRHVQSARVQLLECPVETTRSTSGLIGATGGTIALDGHSITLLPGAVLRPSRFTLTVPASRHVEVDIDVAARDDFRFLVPAEITLSYQRCDEDVEADELTVWHIDDMSGELLEPMGGDPDPENRSITFTSNHLSGFIIAN